MKSLTVEVNRTKDLAVGIASALFVLSAVAGLSAFFFRGPAVLSFALFAAAVITAVVGIVLLVDLLTGSATKEAIEIEVPTDNPQSLVEAIDRT